MGMFNRNNRNSEDELNNSGDAVEYYEDTHNNNGDYTAKLNQFTADYNSGQSRRRDSEPYKEGGYQGNNSYQNSEPKSGGSMNFGGVTNGTKRNYNVMVYEPKTTEHVQTLIDFLKRKEPAIINLDNVEAADSQRILDFVSGAIYALNGSVHRIAGNIFLLSPEDVEITIPYTYD